MQELAALAAVALEAREQAAELEQGAVADLLSSLSDEIDDLRVILQALSVAA